MIRKHRFGYVKKNVRINIQNKKKNNLDSLDSVYTSIYRIQTIQTHYWNSNTIEAGRKVISRLLRKEKKRNIPKCLTLVKHFGISKTSKKKGRMGKGKGKVVKHVSLLSGNSTLYVIRNVSELSMKEIMRQLQKKMPIRLICTFKVTNKEDS